MPMEWVGARKLLVPGRAMRASAAFLLVVGWHVGALFSPHAWAQEIPLASGQPHVLRSSSGQFIVQKTVLLEPRGRLAAIAANAKFIRLEPSLLAVSCERLKQSLDRELELGSSWQGKIFLSVVAATGTNDTVIISSEKFRDGWQYRVVLPQVLSRSKYVTAVTQVLLTEYANRTARSGSAEVPPWLAEGLSRVLLASREVQICLPVPSTEVNGLRLDVVTNSWLERPLEDTHQRLSSAEPVSFHQLSWPEPSLLEGEKGDVFRDCSHLFVCELLRLKGGRPMMQQFLSELPAYLNWQIAFLRAFRPVFQRPLDVEKWWALQVTCFTGRELGQTWSTAESWRKLEEALLAPVRVRSGTNDIGLAAQTTLQGVLRDWPAPQRDEVIAGKLGGLDMLRLRLAPGVVPMMDAYRDLLRKYIAAVDRSNRRTLGLFRSRIDNPDYSRALDDLDRNRRAEASLAAASGIPEVEPATVSTTR